jgi:hypothetical protein
MAARSHNVHENESFTVKCGYLHGI